MIINMAVDIDILTNKGVIALNKPEISTAEKTVIVLGLARGGTTMVASVLQTLGVYMGENLGPVLEDVTLSQAVETNNKVRLAEIVAQRNVEHECWGWKRPSAIEHYDVWQGIFRNPYIISIFRDPFAIANRNRISMLSDVFQNMERSIKSFETLVQILRSQKCPVLLCSYEKVLAFPKFFVQAVDDFLNLNSQDKWEIAAEQICPAPKIYLETSRITHSIGSLDIVTDQICKGWAFYPKQPDRVANVLLSINGQIVYTVEANLLRPDVREKKIHPTGFCGFKLEWPAAIRPRMGDLVAAHVEGDIKNLNGSPKRVKRTEQPIMDSTGTKTTTLQGTTKDAELYGALPSFYGIGEQFYGIAWMSNMLSQHPQVYLPKPRGVHYWDAHKNRSVQWYRKQFKQGFINGDIIPSYVQLSIETINAIYALTPEAKILYVLRNPADCAWEAVQLTIKRKIGANLFDISKKEHSKELFDVARHKLFQPGRLERADYTTVIQRWLSIFGKKAIMFVRYERIIADSRNLLIEICRHIGADSSWTEELSAEQIKFPVPVEKIPFPADLKAEFLNRCAPAIDRLEKLIGENFSEWFV